jgi:selT/selW/selH-like putative selenoprotein
LAGRYGPRIEMSLENYPVAPFRQILAQILTIIKFVLIFTAASQNFNPLVTLGIMSENDPLPDIIDKMKSNKIYACLMIFFTFNAVEGMLISTGAFEIFADDVLIGSKLETGQVMSPQVIIEKLDKIMGIKGTDNFGQAY